MQEETVTEITSVATSPELPDDLTIAREKCIVIMREYQDNRVNWYKNTVSLKRILMKDIAMFAARGILTADEYVESAFGAVESSSEETVMGTHWQKILSAISENTLDTGDLTTAREDILWVCEIKSQPNTINASSFPQELRGLRTRMRENLGRRRASGQPVKAAYCVLRDTRNSGKGVDEIRSYESGSIAIENRDLDGFEYRYISGRHFWKWLTGFDSEIAILMPLSEVAGTRGEAIRTARSEAIERIKRELRDELSDRGLGLSIDDVVHLRNAYSSNSSKPPVGGIDIAV